MPIDGNNIEYNILVCYPNGEPIFIITNEPNKDVYYYIIIEV